MAISYRQALPTESCGAMPKVMWVCVSLGL